MASWDLFKRYFDAWEPKTAALLEEWAKSPVLLEASGAVLTVAMRTKASADRALASAWAMTGLATRRDQERTLHALNQIQSRLVDLEEQLARRPQDRTPGA